MLSKYWKHNPTLMAKEKIINYSEYILSGIVYAVIFVFFAFYYNSHLHFNEQFQLFLLTGDFFIEKLSFPGGFSGYVGGFLTQFYYLSLVGPGCWEPDFYNLIDSFACLCNLPGHPRNCSK